MRIAKIVGTVMLVAMLLLTGLRTASAQEMTEEEMIQILQEIARKMQRAEELLARSSLDEAQRRQMTAEELMERLREEGLNEDEISEAMEAQSEAESAIENLLRGSESQQSEVEEMLQYIIENAPS